jgi:suppressor for copper-sensitivity B
MNIKQVALAGLILAIAVSYVPLDSAFGQIGGFDSSMNNASAELFTRADGGKIQAIIRLKIDKGWHLYSDILGHPDAIGAPTKITLGGLGVKWSKVVFPKPHRLPQKIAEIDAWINSHEGTIILYAAGEVPGDASPPSLSAKIDGLTCSDEGQCVPYGEDLKSLGRGDDALFAKFPADLSVSAKGPADYAPSVDEDARSLAVWLALAFLAGILLNVMPCVLPVISIKVLSFVQQAGESRGRMLALGSVFGAGILLVFWALAIAAITLGLSWGQQFQSFGFMVVMISIVFAFALSLLGVFTLGVPKQVNTMAAGIGREGLGNAFFNGMLATLLATPCTGPFLGSTLAWTLAQTPVTIFLIFTMLGLGMALPYVVLTAFPRLLAFVPKPGAWMETFKEAMGFLLLVTVVYLMISVQRDKLLFLNAFLVFVGIAAWCWGRYAKFGQKPVKRWATVGVTVAILAIGAQLSLVTMQNAFALPASDGEAERIAWKQEFDSHIQAGRTVFVDFTATWCPNCVWNEKLVFQSDEIQALMKKKGVVTMIADITNDSPRTRMLEEMRKKLGGRSLPFLAVYPSDRPDKPITRPDLVTIGIMLDIFNSVPDPKPSE